VPGLPGSDEFRAAYRDTLADSPRVEIGASRTMPGTINDLIVRIYGSAEFTLILSETTQKYRRNIIERFPVPRGDRPVNMLEQRHVAAILEQTKRPHARKSWLKAIRVKYAVQIGMIAKHPTVEIKVVKPQKSDVTRHGVKHRSKLSATSLHSAPAQDLRLNCCSIQQTPDQQAFPTGRAATQNGRLAQSHQRQRAQAQSGNKVHGVTEPQP
jgi:hypothetical protein